MSLKSFIGGVARIGVGLATGGVGGALTSAFGGAGRPPGPTGALPFGGILNAGPKINMPFPVKGPGGVPLPGFGGGAASSCPRGYHLNKKPLAACKSHGAVAARTMCVRNRTMNPMNWRALTRGLKRVKRAGKIVRKLHAFQPVRRSAPSRPVAISENLRITSGRQ